MKTTLTKLLSFLMEYAGLIAPVALLLCCLAIVAVGQASGLAAALGLNIPSGLTDLNEPAIRLAFLGVLLSLCVSLLKTYPKLVQLMADTSAGFGATQREIAALAAEVRSLSSRLANEVVQSISSELTHRYTGGLMIVEDTANAWRFVWDLVSVAPSFRLEVKIRDGVPDVAFVDTERLEISILPRVTKGSSTYLHHWNVYFFPQDDGGIGAIRRFLILTQALPSLAREKGIEIELNGLAIFLCPGARHPQTVYLGHREVDGRLVRVTQQYVDSPFRSHSARREVLISDDKMQIADAEALVRTLSSDIEPVSLAELRRRFGTNLPSEVRPAKAKPSTILDAVESELEIIDQGDGSLIFRTVPKDRPSTLVPADP